MKLTGKVALITGAGKGIGRAIAVRFAEEGAAVVLNDVIPASVESLAETIDQTGERVLAVRADVCHIEEVRSMFEQAIGRFGRVDILVNNAGVRKDNPFHLLSEEEWDFVLNVNLKGAYNCSRIAQQKMAELNYGKIVNISSPVLPSVVGAGQTHYSAASAGIEGFTKALALELGKHNVNVNCISPDFIDTDMTRQASQKTGIYWGDFKKLAASRVALRRLGIPADVANLALFLVSDEASFITGQVIYVRGGP